MPYFTLNRNLSVNSVQGACINFLRDIPEFVPEFMRQEVEDKGAVEVEAPEVDEPFNVPVMSASNTAPVVCTVDAEAITRISTGDTVSLNTPTPIQGTILTITADSFDIEGSDLTAEIAPLTGLTAEITPERQAIKSSGKYEVCEEQPPEDEEDREAAMHKAFETMVIQGKAGDDHVPSVRDTSEAVGFKVTAAERDAAWDSFKTGQ